MTSIIQKYNWFVDLFRSTHGCSQYLTYRVTHQRHDSLMKRIRNSPEKIYEAVETKLIATTLRSIQQPIVLDIGANIGLMSLNICSTIQDSRIFAFEPGPGQYQYLKKNIEINQLNERVKIFNIALGSHSGKIDFHVHAIKDSSGDGLLDTGRAGHAQVVKINCERLNNWWHLNHEPSVALIKLDTEGSELSILEHGIELIDQCRPHILIEICHLNYEMYGLKFSDYLDFFKIIDYTLINCETNEVVIEYNQEILNQFYFWAKPNGN